MITSRTWAGKRYAVLGLARSGAATVRALLASGASVVAWDADEGARLRFIEQFHGHGRGENGLVEHFWGGESDNTAANDSKVEVGNLEMSDLAEFDALVVSPGIPLNRDHTAMLARGAGTPIIGDIELFAQARADLPPHKVVGITGTNGKSTTTALVTHILKTAGVPALMGGNIGLPILAQEPLPEGGVYVLELSSYQIDLTQTLDCEVAVLLNITPDHLDRYNGSFEAYAASKARLFEMQSDEHDAVASAADWWGKEVGSRSNAGYLDVYEDVFHIRRGEPDAIGIFEQSEWPALQGPHNLLNASAAMSVCYLVGLTTNQIREGFRTFPGLPHRMERVATLGGVTWYDDSKATNPESTAPALAAFPRVHWILGGRAKGEDLDACLPHLGHVAHAYTIGEAGPTFARVLAPHVPVTQAETLDRAVALAAEGAQRGEVVLLSPAAASFDQFRDYEHRGQVFRSLVEALA